MGLLSRVVERLRTGAADDDGTAHIAGEAECGITPIGETADRRRSRIQGRVSALTLPTAAPLSGLVVDLADRTGSISLVFVGRKAIPGIECGVTLRVEGLVSSRNGRLVMYNPVYEIVPPREH